MCGVGMRSKELLMRASCWARDQEEEEFVCRRSDGLDGAKLPWI